MSAGFKVAGEVFWGTNGAVEACLEVLAAQAAVRFGRDDRLGSPAEESRIGDFTWQLKRQWRRWFPE
jgi:hypothetical protein